MKTVVKQLLTQNLQGFFRWMQLRWININVTLFIKRNQDIKKVLASEGDVAESETKGYKLINNETKFNYTSTHLLAHS